MKNITVLACLILDLSLILLGKALFRKQPLSVERAEGLEAVFWCQYQVERSTVTYNWAINHSIVTTELDTDTVKVHRSSSPGGPTTLIILATPQHNNSVVQCVAKVINGTDIVRSAVSATATLTVRATIITDVLAAPNTITVIWNALPLTRYCVDISKTTERVYVVVDSICTHRRWYIFTYFNPISVCDRFSFTVTPTKEKMRGTTSEPVTGFFTKAEGSIEQHRILENGDTKSVEFEASIPSCTRFTRYRVDSDLLSTPINLPITDPLLFDGSLSFSLPTDKKTEYSVTLTDENGIDLVFENIPISTFDIQDLLVSECPGPGGGICVSIEYVKGTVSPGALVYAVRIIDGELDFASTKLVPIRRNMSDNFTIPVAVSGKYSVVAFDLENNIMSVPRIPTSLVADNETIFWSNESSTVPNSPPNSEGIIVTKLSNGSAEVTCTTTGQSCLALFQSKTSPTSLDSMVMIGFIEPPNVRTTVTLNATTNVYVIVYTWNSDSGETIFDGKVSFISQLELPITTQPSTTDTTISEQTTSSSGTTSAQGCTEGCIAGIVVGFLIVLVLVVVIIVVVLCYWSKTKNSESMEVSRYEMGRQSEKLTPSHGDQVDPVSAPPTETFKNADAADPPADKSPDVIPGNEDVDAGPDSNALIYADLEMATKGKNKAKVDATVTPTGGAEGHEAVEYASIEHFKKSDKSEGDEDN